MVAEATADNVTPVTPTRKLSSELRGLVCVVLRGANVGRKRMHCGRMNSGEAVVVGGDYHFGCTPPARDLFTGGAHFSPI